MKSEFRVAFEERKDSVCRFAWRMTNYPAAAEDMISPRMYSSCFCASRTASMLAGGQLRSFLLGVARNLARKWLRGQHRWDVLDDEEFIVEPLNIESHEIAEVVGAAVQTLPPLQREVLILAQYEDFSLDEITRPVEVGTE